MARISDEELEQMQADERHGDLIAALRSISEANATEGKALRDSLEKTSKALTMAAGKELIAPDLSPMIVELTKGMNAVAAKIADPRPMPKSFKVERGKTGLIERILIEH